MAIQNYDTKTQKSLPANLKKYGVAYDDYDRYQKLNRLSMVYHLQEVTGYDEDALPMYDADGREVSPADRLAWQDMSGDVPAVRNIYEYRNDEVLAKLFSVKNWLERYITGVNCYISDINGECIVLERFKTVGYVT